MNSLASIFGKVSDEENQELGIGNSGKCRFKGGAKRG
jgi:hypothetical protein